MDGFACEAAGVGGGESGEVADELLQGALRGLHVAAAMLGAPFAGDLIDDLPQLLGRGQRQLEQSAELAQFLWHLQAVPDHHHRVVVPRITQCDVLEETDQHVVFEERVEIQQHEQAILRVRLDVM